jgi:hypothetical protein
MLNLILQFAIPVMTSAFILFLFAVFFQFRAIQKSTANHEVRANKRHCENMNELSQVSSNLFELKKMVNQIKDFNYNNININISIGLKVEEILPQIGYENFEKLENDNGQMFLTGEIINNDRINFSIVIQKGIEEVLISSFSYLVKEKKEVLIPLLFELTKDNVIGCLNYEQDDDGLIVQVEYATPPMVITSNYLKKIIKELSYAQEEIKSILDDKKIQYENISLSNYGSLGINQ